MGVSYDVRGDRDLIFVAGAGAIMTGPCSSPRALRRSSRCTSRNDDQFLQRWRLSGIPSCADLRSANGGVLPVGTVPSMQAIACRGLLTCHRAKSGRRIWWLNNKTKHPIRTVQRRIRKRLGDWQTSATLRYIRSNNIFQFVRGTAAGWQLPDDVRDGERSSSTISRLKATSGLQRQVNHRCERGQGALSGALLQADKPTRR